MATLYNQPMAHRFGVSLIDHLRSGEWRTLEVAVAWVRRSGTRHVLPALEQFLRDGGSALFTVGIDVENTSEEGLADLLSLERVGSCSIHIYHNESPQEVFHPKIYLLSNASRARLIIGSNNFTAGGLFTNTEAGLQVDESILNPVVIDAQSALAAWRDPTSDLIRYLNAALLADLVRLGYVLPEAKLAERRKASGSTRGAASEGRRLFGRANREIPRIVNPGAPEATTAVGRVLLLRPRRASEKERRTQIQLPIRLVRTAFFDGVNEIESAHDGRKHRIISASARGSLNTLKVEVPEINEIDLPVMRLERGPDGITYQAYAEESKLGRPLMDALRNGRTLSPPATVLTTPRAPRSATWFRFV